MNELVKALLAKNESKGKAGESPEVPEAGKDLEAVAEAVLDNYSDYRAQYGEESFCVAVDKVYEEDCLTIRVFVPREIVTHPDYKDIDVVYCTTIKNTRGTEEMYHRVLECVDDLFKRVVFSGGKDD